MRRIPAFLLIALATPSLRADVTLAVGGEGTLTLPAASPGAAVYADLSAVLYRSLGPAAALLGDGAATVTWEPALGVLEASADASTRLELGLAGMRWRATLEGGADLSTAAGASGRVSAALWAGWEGLSLGLSLEPRATVYFADRLRWAPTIQARFDALAGSSVILTLEAGGGLDIPNEGVPEPGLWVSLAAEWLPAAPVVIRGSVDARRRFSDNTETLLVDGVSVIVPGYWGYAEAGASLGVDLALGRRWDAWLDLPASIRLSDHGALLDATVQAGQAWTVAIGPVMGLGVAVADPLRLELTLGDEVRISDGLPPTNEMRVALDLVLSLP